ncbi:MAG: oxidoreductase of aldo/keto reductase family, subgroup 1 [uncultured Nocardioidaceae bacterium]|uniref:Oxidoreductase of aldo/keto reductase family, subgroup 1 n=1 Tax=uncultured Nocardioidaceae bacterium TaxID=253824 RepID=A0A6J4LYL5_9ACTN|nr:MAG: oxidoreductase of aldo/keto reductase family, subgroup 1 [uncultured Nocardioidaceae bacterium]
MTSSTPDPARPSLPPDAADLPGGGRMPLLGFGTWQLTGEDALTATQAALDAGYRHLDTATIYGNEAEVGEALRRSGVPREEVFLTTKCPPANAGREIDTLRQSLQQLGVDRVDLWLVHWAAPGPATARMWQAFTRAQADGLTTDIGVSNFDAALLDEVTQDSGVVPAVNQVEWSPYLFDAAVLQAHQERGVVLEGYSALRGGTLEDPVVVSVAERLGRTPAQVIVRWHLQHGIVVIPKSREAARLRSNADVAGFELTAEDMAALDGLGGRR